MVLVSMLYFGPRQSFDVTSLLFSGQYTLSARTCIRRTVGRCCRNSVSDRSRAWKLTPIYATADGIRTYPHLLEGRNVVYIHYMFILNDTRLYMLEDGGP
jgi:hypothetical protein